MKLFKKWWGGQREKFRARRHKGRLVEESKEAMKNPPLREFVYLDTVSLHSLLVSQNATIPDEVSEAISRADEAEVAGKTTSKIGSDVVGASAQAELGSRFQTSNSNSTQSSRKAVIQTLFKELRELPLEFKLARRSGNVDALGSVETIVVAGNSGIVEPATAFERGTLIEVEVVLAVDPVFKLGSMMTEWNAMADDFPAMFGEAGTLGFLRQSQPVIQVLDRFLAGLIPIKATAVNHVVATVNGQDYVVHRSAIHGLSLETRPLLIAGVTEHIGYWKDLRRILFSDAQFTILGRIARHGIHKKWTPVKLADLFSEVAPDFVDQINAIRSPSADASGSPDQQRQQAVFAAAIDAYRDGLIPVDKVIDQSTAVVYEAAKRAASAGSQDALSQRRVFDVVRDLLVDRLGLDRVPPEVDLTLRKSARAASGLELFPSLSSAVAPSATTAPNLENRPDERLLDIEVIAIYW